MKNRKNIIIVPLVIAFVFLAQIQGYAADVSVNDSAFLNEIPVFTQFSSGKEEAYYKIFADTQLKVIKFKLRIRDKDFGKTPPEMSVALFDQNNTQILIPSSQKEIKNDKYSCISYFEYSNKSQTADFNIEIALFSPIFDEVSVNCVMLGETYKVCDFVKLGFDFSHPTKPSTTKVITTTKASTTEKTTSTKNTTSKNSVEKTTTSKSTTDKSVSEKATTEKLQKGTNKPAANQDAPESTVLNENVDSENPEGQQLEVTKLEKQPMNSKAKTSLALAFGIGGVAIITVALALVANNRMRKNQAESIDATETDDE